MANLTQNNAVEIAYWAGFFDGEGSIGIYKYQNKDRWHKSPTYSIMASLVQIDKGMIDALDVFFRGTRAVRRHPKSIHLQYYWQVKGNRAALLLERLLPFLRLKKKQAVHALIFHRERVRTTLRLTNEELAYREAMYQEAKRLNAH